MGGVFSADCQHGTLDVTKWYQTSRQCKSASSTHEIRASRGTETLETAKADNNCNIQHAPASCWGLWKTGTDTPIYCLENQFAVLPEPLSDSFPQQAWFAGACADGCSTFCPEEDAVAAPVCNWDGPLEGEISPEGSRGIGGGGEALSGELELEDAKLACEADVTCTGVDSTWYIGKPFVARKGAFTEDRSSYGLTYIKYCDGTGPLPPLPRSATAMQNAGFSVAGIACFAGAAFVAKKKHAPIKRNLKKLLSSFGSQSFAGGSDGEPIEMQKTASTV
ncbi:hypothetical protein TeGR_g10706 [Tetraparma gracilis]|uniref:Uncharacterized protein n=1 Tax=Tetraparma gracilis TaxID=2962635 RepID=A0ABQ6MKG6_9STRA|nr:hypothetical protein TeGR_g10706 [Tetraparma gracilis]